jgi:hypothetical protein
MAAWTGDELATIGAAEELTIAPRRGSGTPRAPTTIWVVRVGDDVYVRSWRGPTGRWFRAAQRTREGRISAGGVEKDVRFVVPDVDVNEAVDAAYRAKYGRYSGYVEPMVAPAARATTLKLVPCGEPRRAG